MRSNEFEYHLNLMYCNFNEFMSALERPLIFNTPVFTQIDMNNLHDFYAENFLFPGK